MNNPKPKFVWFPKDYEIRLTDAFYCWLFLGIIGGHQIYLRNKNKAIFYLVTCGFTDLMILLAPLTGPKLYSVLGMKGAAIFIFSGYLIALPFWIWDGITLHSQVRNKAGMINPF